VSGGAGTATVSASARVTASAAFTRGRRLSGIVIAARAAAVTARKASRSAAMTPRASVVTLEKSLERLAELYPDGPKALPPELT
jgi:hypothetical protein